MALKVVHLVEERTLGGVNLALQDLQVAFDPQLCQMTIEQLDPHQLLVPKYDADVICIHIASSWSKLLLFAALKLRHPNCIFIYQEHHYCQAFVSQCVSQPTRFYRMLALTYSMMDKVFTVSSAQQQWLQQLFPQHSAKLINVGQAKQLDTLLELAPRTLTKPLMIGAYGRLHQQKGFDLLLQAIAQFSPEQVQCKLAGAGAQASYLGQLAQSSVHVELIGELQLIEPLLAHSDVVVIPSRWEPFGLVCQEALVAGKAIIATNIDGLTEQLLPMQSMLPHNQKALLQLINANSVAELVTAITRLLQYKQVTQLARPSLQLPMAIRTTAANRYDAVLAQWSHQLTS